MILFFFPVTGKQKNTSESYFSALRAMQYMLKYLKK